MELRGATALITGGASGLGAATARRLHAGGAAVVLVDLPGTRAEEAGRDLARELASMPGAAPAAFVPADVTDEAQVRAAVALASGRISHGTDSGHTVGAPGGEPSSAAASGTGGFGPLRIVVNCAGIATPGKVLGWDGVLPLEEFERVVRVNLLGTFNVLRLAAEAIAQTEPVSTELGGPERGVIVNTASVAAFDGQIGQPAYSASKGAVHAMTLPIARELARSLIRVMTIAPGIFETPMLAGLSQEAQDSLGKQVPHPARLGRPAEYANLVAHIVDNAMLNGETIRLDGAIRMAPK